MSVPYPVRVGVRLDSYELVEDISSISGCRTLQLPNDEHEHVILLEESRSYSPHDKWLRLIDTIRNGDDEHDIASEMEDVYGSIDFWAGSPINSDIGFSLNNTIVFREGSPGRLGFFNPVEDAAYRALRAREWSKPVLYIGLAGDQLDAHTLQQLSRIAAASGRHLIVQATPTWDWDSHHANTYRGSGVYLYVPREASWPGDDVAAEEWRRLAGLAGTEFIDFLRVPDLDIFETPPAHPIVGLEFESITVMTTGDFVMAAAIIGMLDESLDNGSADPLSRLRRSLDRRLAEQAASYDRNERELEQRRQQALSSYITYGEQIRTLQRSRFDGEDQATNARGLELMQTMLDNGIITRVRMSRNRLIVETGPVYIQDDRSGMWHDIGRMEMSIDYDAGNYRFVNLDRNIPSLDYSAHPHVQSNGTPCLGTLTDAIPQMRDNRDWPLMVEMGLAFLQSANTADYAGQNLHHFPVVLDPEAVGLPPHEGKATFHGLPLPKPTEGDFGEYGRHAVVMREGELHYLSRSGYINAHGSIVRRILDDADLRMLNSEHRDIIVRYYARSDQAPRYFAWDEEHQCFLDQRGRNTRGEKPVKEEELETASS